MTDRYVFVSQPRSGKVEVVNYDISNFRVNTFLVLFDINHGHGQFKTIRGSSVGVCFECSTRFSELLRSPELEKAFTNMGVELIFECPIIPSQDTRIGKEIKIQTNSGWVAGILMGILDKNTAYDYPTFKRTVIDRFPEYWNLGQDYWKDRNRKIVLSSALKPKPYTRLVLQTQQGTLFLPVEDSYEQQISR